MKKLKKYSKQIFAFITIFLLLEFGIFPSLTSQSTLSNILGGIGLLLLIVWGFLEIYDFLKDETNIFNDEIEKDNDSFEQKDEFQIRAGIKGDRQKSTMNPELAKEIANNWSGKIGVEDPLMMIPFSRLSREAKEKMVEIAKEDIRSQLEREELNFKKIKNILTNNVQK